MKHAAWGMHFTVWLMLCASAYAQNGGLKFTLTDLGTFGLGGYQSEAYAINNSGQIVGDYFWSLKRTSGQECFSKMNGQAAVLFGSSTCTARALNASGSVAGWMSVGSASHAFRFDPSGNLYDLPPTSGNQYSYGHGIDYFGRVAGEDRDGNGEFGGALQWDLTGHATPLCATGHAYATNSAGNIVAGQCGYSPFWLLIGTSYYGYLPTLGDPGVSCVGWGGVEGGGEEAVIAMNESNQMVGVSQDETNYCHHPHAVLWQNYAIVDLGAGAIAEAISNDAWIVGVYSPGPGAFLRVPDPVCPLMVNLNLLLDSSGKGWSVIASYGINDSHQIVGQGLAPNGQYHAILLTPANKFPLCKPV